jgi:hypothetical protein
MVLSLPPSLHSHTCDFVAPLFLLTHPHTDSEPSLVDVPHISDTHKAKNWMSEGAVSRQGTGEGSGGVGWRQRFPAFLLKNAV